MQGGIKAAVCSLLSSPSLVGFRSELFSYLRNMLFGLARSLTALTVGDSSVWPCPRCFSSRGAALQRYVGQAACRRRRFHRRRREERWREKEGETARAPRHARALSCQSWRGEWAYPLARSPDYLPSCPRSHAHIAHGDRAITSMSSLDAARLGLPGAPSLPSPLSKHLYGKKGDARIERWPGRKSTSWDVECGPFKMIN